VKCKLKIIQDLKQSPGVQQFTVNADTARKLDIAFPQIVGDIRIRNLAILTFKQLKRCKCKHDFMNIVKITEFDNLPGLSNTFILQRLVELWLIIIVVQKSGCISKVWYLWIRQ